MAMTGNYVKYIKYELIWKKNMINVKTAHL